MTNFSFWQRWLFVVGIAVSVFGLYMAFFSGTPLFESFNRQIDPAFWGTNVVENSAREFQNLPCSLPYSAHHFGATQMYRTLGGSRRCSAALRNAAEPDR